MKHDEFQQQPVQASNRLRTGATEGKDVAVLPALLTLDHLVKLGLAPSTDAARKASRRWPVGLRAVNTGRRLLFVRDRVLRHLGLVA